MKITSCTNNMLNYKLNLMYSNNSFPFASTTLPSNSKSPKRTKEISFESFRVKTRLIGFLTRLPIKLTKYDTEQIQATRRRIMHKTNSISPTISDNSQERQNLRTYIIQHLLQRPTDIRLEKNLYYVIGVPGAGKSTISQVITKNKKALPIDLDEIKSQIPEYQKDQDLSYVVKAEAELIRDNLLSTAIEKGYNIVLENCGFVQKEMLDTFRKAKQKNYKIHFVLVDLPADVAISRAMNRFNNTGRYTEPLNHQFMGNKPRYNYEDLIHSHPEYFESYGLFSSNVALTTPFKLVSAKNLDLNPTP